MSKNETSKNGISENDLLVIILGAAVGLAAFGGAILAFGQDLLDRFTQWLVNLNVMVPASQSTVAVTADAGFDTGRVIVLSLIPITIVATVIWSMIRKRRRQEQVSRIADPLTVELGSEFNPATDLKASKFTKDGPQRVKVNYPNSNPDHDPLWRMKIEELVRHRMGSPPVTSKWDLKHGKFDIRAKAFVSALEQAISRRQEESVVRLETIFGRFFNGQATVRVDSWATPGTTDSDGNIVARVVDIDGSEVAVPESFTVKYPSGVMITDTGAIRIAQVLALKLGGRWKVDNNPRIDALTAYRKPGFPEMIRHPGPGLYSTVTGKTNMLYYGRDENGQDRGWRIGQSQPMPHMICVGATGGGKTTVFRSLLVGAVMQGIGVYACDPKRVELRPFQGFPGVGAIASSGEQITKLVAEVTKVMFDRYEVVEHYPEAKDQLPPILFLVDELLILRQLVTEYAASEKERNKKEEQAKKAEQGPRSTRSAGTKPPKTPTPDANDKNAAADLAQQAGFSANTEKQLQMMLALARTARIHIVVGVQRPDAEHFQGGARDNLTHRCALMPLSTQGAIMVWGQGNGHVGVDLPRKQGRAMANVSPLSLSEATPLDGSLNGGAVELQTYWISEPGAAKGEDQEILDAIASAAKTKFEGYQFPIDSAPYDIVPGELSQGARRILNQLDIPLGTENPQGLDSEDPVTKEPAKESVNAGSLAEGDSITLDGEIFTVADIEELGDAEEDRILLTVQDASGNSQTLDTECTDRMDRILETEDFGIKL
ncbi:FtsK/SpoIIIE domain-containing protein [Acaricomes phytoseiuli]|uniref:FtsK/SpoIIIE domain-containing protein n=1 Tax=Acaricomes phytoseiuli TaxID=291968 RepID=UPI00037A6979|nr:FtsK/SpoIIIE domain-containing protein [Acaricomes phytoseiuli]